MLIVQSTSDCLTWVLEVKSGRQPRFDFFSYFQARYSTCPWVGTAIEAMDLEKFLPYYVLQIKIKIKIAKFGWLISPRKHSQLDHTVAFAQKTCSSSRNKGFCIWFSSVGLLSLFSPPLPVILSESCALQLEIPVLFHVANGYFCN